MHSTGLGRAPARIDQPGWLVPACLPAALHVPLLLPHPRCTAQVRETDSFHVAKLAKRNKETQDDIIVLLPTVEVAGQRCHMRSLGYMGSFLLAYSSAQVGRLGAWGFAPLVLHAVDRCRPRRVPVGMCWVMNQENSHPQALLSLFPTLPPQAQDLRYQLSTGTLRPGARLMLDLATDPRKKPDTGSSTLRPLHLLPGALGAANSCKCCVAFR